MKTCGKDFLPCTLNCKKMSLNIMDTFFDKLSLASKDRNIPLGKKFTGTQNFLGTNNSYGLSQSIPSEITRAFMDPEYFTQAHNRMNRSSSLDSKMNYFHFPTNDRLVSRVSKLFTPMFTHQDCFRLVPSLDILDHEIMNKMFCEEIEQHLDMFSKIFVPIVKPEESASFKFESPNKQSKDFKPVPLSDKVTSHQQSLSSIVDNTPNQSKAMNSKNNTSNIESLSGHHKELISNIKSDKDTCQQTNLSTSFNDSFNQSKMHDSYLPTAENGSYQAKASQQASDIKSHLESNSHIKSDKSMCHQTNFPTSVKSQEISQDTATTAVQKNKKQLNNNHTMNKELTNRKNKELHKRSKKRRRRQKKINVVLDKPKGKNEIPTSQADISKDSDILCDITIDDSTSSVQILLPNTSSFVISIEDDSDWESNDDCDWLTDSSEFELSGIFISNLSLPLTSPSSRDMCFSHLSVPPSYAEEMEMCRLGAVLRQVNMDWIESTRGLDTKPKVATKVSFAPDSELVEVVHVDIYERKGEWETYACERMRFKRRIDELEKIISPCLSKEHREKVFLRLQDSNL